MAIARYWSTGISTDTNAGQPTLMIPIAQLRQANRENIPKCPLSKPFHTLSSYIAPVTCTTMCLLRVIRFNWHRYRSIYRGDRSIRFSIFAPVMRRVASCRRGYWARDPVPTTRCAILAPSRQYVLVIVSRTIKIFYWLYMEEKIQLNPLIFV